MNEIIMPKIVKEEIKIILIDKLKYRHILKDKTLIFNALINYKVDKAHYLKLSISFRMSVVIETQE
jgi:hypothetical protein